MSMNDFPPELIELTLGFIKSNKKRRTLRLVCKKWQKYLGMVYFDIDIILRRHVRPISNTLFRCSQPFSVKSNKADKLSSNDYNILFGNVSNMISMEILFKEAFLRRDVFDINLSFANLIKLQRLVIPHHNVSIEYLQLPNLTHLEVNTIYFKDPNCFPNLQRLWLLDDHIPISIVAPKLTALKVNTTISSESEYEFVKGLRVLHLSAIMRFKERSFPNLEELRLITCDSIGQCDKLTKLHIVNTHDVRFIRKLTSLRDLVLKIAGDTVLIESNLTVLKNIQELNSFEASCVPEDGFKGNFFEYLNPDTLTQLVFSSTADRLNERMALFTNLQRLELVVSEEEPDLIILSNLVNLTKLMISADYIYNLNMQWVSHLTALISLSMTHIQKEDEKPDLNTLTNLTKLKFIPQGSILPIPNLTKLRVLNIEAAEDYSCLLNMPKLTSLTIERCSQSPIDHVIQIPKLRKLTLNIFSNDQIKALTALQKLTKLVLFDRKKECNPDTLTHLTRLQIAKMIGYQGSSGIWTLKDSPKIQEKFPYALN